MLCWGGVHWALIPAPLVLLELKAESSPLALLGVALPKINKNKNIMGDSGSGTSLFR